MVGCTVIYTTNIMGFFANSFTDTNQIRLLKMLNEVKAKALEIHNERNKIIHKFNIKFEQLVNNYFKPPLKLWALSQSDMNILDEKDSKLIDLPLRYLCIQRMLRKLFFTDFIPFCYEYNFRINVLIRNEQEPGGYFNCHYLNNIFKKLNPSLKFSATVCANMNFFSTLKPTAISFSCLLEKLEDLVETRTGNSKEFIRRCLYYTPRGLFDVCRAVNGGLFCHTVSFFLHRSDQECSRRECKNCLYDDLQLESSRIVKKVVIINAQTVLCQESHYPKVIETQDSPSLEYYIDEVFFKHKNNEKTLSASHSILNEADENLLQPCWKTYNIILKIKGLSIEKVYFAFDEEEWLFYNDVLRRIDNIYKFSNEPQTQII
ncbi:hypothetical protein CDIK_1933 [Cucumispora dikerogammari]|nr:hypothetical protein CDIK_1933 [Cucumispora dikerogammari]